MSTESTATATKFEEGAYRVIYYYKDDITELTPTERAELAHYIREVHTDAEVVETPYTGSLRLLEIIEDPEDIHSEYNRMGWTEGGVITLDYVS